MRRTRRRSRVRRTRRRRSKVRSRVSRSRRSRRSRSRSKMNKKRKKRGNMEKNKSINVLKPKKVLKKKLLAKNKTKVDNFGIPQEVVRVESDSPPDELAVPSFQEKEKLEEKKIMNKNKSKDK